MLCSFTIRFRNCIWFLIFTFSLYSMPHLELIIPLKLHLFFTPAEASETLQELPTQNQSQASSMPDELLSTPPPSDRFERKYTLFSPNDVFNYRHLFFSDYAIYHI